MGDVPGWPVLQPVGRVWTWLGRGSMSLIAAAALLQIPGIVIDGQDRPGWRWALLSAAALLTLSASARAWVLAGRVHRLRPDPARPTATAGENRAARAALRAGGLLTDRQRLLVAVEVAQLELWSLLVTGFTAVAASQIVNWSATVRMTATAWIGMAVSGYVLIIVGVFAIALWRCRRLRDAAAEIGAEPCRPSVR